jgi:hypothetical protein
MHKCGRLYGQVRAFTELAQECKINMRALNLSDFSWNPSLKSNPVFSSAIILASLMESYYRYQFHFGFREVPHGELG